MRKILEQQNVVFDPETIELQIVQRSGVPVDGDNGSFSTKSCVGSIHHRLGTGWRAERSRVRTGRLSFLASCQRETNS